MFSHALPRHIWPHARSPAFEERVRSTIRHESAVSQDADVSHLIVHMTETTAGYNVWSGYYPLTNALIVDLSRQAPAPRYSKTGKGPFF